jgi:8-oxo-dGTP pyrophosphatase MutT (NUDIX family)
MTNEHSSEATAAPLRPRDAATLIILKPDGGTPKVLMGKRHENHRFMPGKFVFPGGRVDYADSRVKPCADLPSHDAEKLLERVSGRRSPARAQALAMAAVRETFEETGIPLGRATGSEKRMSKSAPWQAFLDTGVRPDLSVIRFIARAITPPGRPRRYDTRFFLTHAADWHDIDFTASSSNELTEVHWLDLKEAQSLDLPRVTSVLLHRIEDTLRRKEEIPFSDGIPFFYHRPKGWVRDRL